MAARRVIVQTGAARTAAIATQQVGRDAAFVDVDILSGIVQGLRVSPLPTVGRDVSAPLFVGVNGFF